MHNMAPRRWFSSRRHRVEPITAGYDIALIGAGRVGQTLGRLLVALGHRLTIVACRTRAAAERAVAFIGIGQPTTYDEAPLEVVQTGRGCRVHHDGSIRSFWRFL